MAKAAKAKKALVNESNSVDAWMAAFDHPLKAEMQAVREAILAAHPGITERIKWAAPSFGYKTDMATFNHRTDKHVHLVMHNGAVMADESGYLEGNYVDRRMMYFKDAAEVATKKSALQDAIRAWVRYEDGQ
jgi:hypothetical protein